MKAWDQILNQKHTRYYASGGSTLFLPPPLSRSEIHNFQTSTGYKWTDEFFDLYTHHDGVGIIPPDEEVIWSFVPTHKINSFGDSTRAWFSATHPDIAKCFYPFFDWMSGDALGYLNIERFTPGTLFEFEHESYEFDAAQSWEIFLKPAYNSIQDFLES